MTNFVLPTSNNSLRCFIWSWQTGPNPWSTFEPVEWHHYSGVENVIMEDPHKRNQPQVMLDNSHIAFDRTYQIPNIDRHQRRSIKGVEHKRGGKYLREEHFMGPLVSLGPSFNHRYDSVSPFLIEIKKYMNLEADGLPSKAPTMIPTIVEKAAQGIIEEAKHIGKERKAEKIAAMLRKKKHAGIEEVWKQCAYLYTMESFLYKILNTTMKLIGDKEKEEVWRSKVSTLGPFCLLLWDSPFNKEVIKSKAIYRGADLKPAEIAQYEEMAKDQGVGVGVGVTRDFRE